MAPLQSVPRRAAPRSADRLDRDRQAAPQVFQRLRGMIISLELPPGSPLSRAALAGQFGVSSTPIRDALMRLEEEGLVDVFPQYATVVSRVDVRLAQQAHFLRQAFELEIVRMLALRRDEAFAVELHAMPRPTSRTSGRWCAAAAGISTGCAGCTCPPPARPRISCGITS